jgi:hypothetical protein
MTGLRPRRRAARRRVEMNDSHLTGEDASRIKDERPASLRSVHHAGTGVHFRLEWAFTMERNGCSLSSECAEWCKGKRPIGNGEIVDWETFIRWFEED